MRLPLENRSVYLLVWSLLAIVAILLAAYWYYLHHLPKPTFYLQESFSTKEAFSQWEGEDASWQGEGRIRLSREQFLAPYLMKRIAANQAPSGSFAISYRVRPQSFSDDALTISSFQFPAGTFALIINQQGQLGTATHLFAQPQYSRSSLALDQWHTLTIFFDQEANTYTVFANDQSILKGPMELTPYPLQEIWLGAIWLKGGGNYGSPLNVEYGAFSIGNEGIIPAPSFASFLFNRLWN